jgi:hypothetical protein
MEAPMADRPIIFSVPMIRALLEGRKTQTRRIIRQPREKIIGCSWVPSTGTKVTKANPPWMHATRPMSYGTEIVALARVPCRVSDRLWVRENWRVGKPHDGIAPAAILPPLLDRGKGITVLYEAGGWRSVGPVGRDEPVYPDTEPMPDWAGKARPSIHMPRWASRLTLKVTGVKIERLQEISEADARVEGILWVPGHGEITPSELRGDPGYSNFLNCREGFSVLWDTINGRRASWSSNPWVVAITFEVIKENIDAMDRAT